MVTSNTIDAMAIPIYIMDGDNIQENTLFHGTDRRVIEMSDNERMEYLDDCSRSIDYLWPFYEPIYKKDLTIGVLKERLISDEDISVWYNLCNALTCNNARLNGNQSYQYGDFYLTTEEWKAENYARRAFAGGEKGLIAYRMYDAAQRIKFDNWYPSTEVARAFKRIKDFAECKEEPIVLAFNNLDIKYMSDAKGRPIMVGVFQDLRYTKPIDLNLYEAKNHLDRYFSTRDLVIR